MFNKTTNIFTIFYFSVFCLSTILDAKKNSGTSSKMEDIVSLAEFKQTLSKDKTVSSEFVTFKNRDIKMAGILFAPANVNEDKKYPAIVVVHPGGGSKDQAASLYAYRLAQLGYVALAFDASHQGESGGEPRMLEDPNERVEDVRSAVDYISTLSFVNVEKIGALGVCAGGGYAISAATTEHRIKAVVGVSAVDFGQSVRNGWRNTLTVNDRIKTLEAVSNQRTAEANGAEKLIIPYVPDTIDGVTEPDMIEASDYYRQPNRWLHKNSPNRFLHNSLDKLSAFSAFGQISTLLTQPILLIAGSNAGSRWQSEGAYKLAKSPKELYIIKGATHMSLYDKDVSKAIPKIKAFFDKTLKL